MTLSNKVTGIKYNKETHSTNLNMITGDIQIAIFIKPFLTKKN